MTTYNIVTVRNTPHYKIGNTWYDPGTLDRKVIIKGLMSKQDAIKIRAYCEKTELETAKKFGGSGGVAQWMIRTNGGNYIAYK